MVDVRGYGHQSPYRDPLKQTDEGYKDNNKRYRGNLRTPSPKSDEPGRYRNPLGNPGDNNKDNTKRYESNIRTPSPKHLETKPYRDPLTDSEVPTNRRKRGKRENTTSPNNDKPVRSRTKRDESPSPERRNVRRTPSPMERRQRDTPVGVNSSSGGHSRDKSNERVENARYPRNHSEERTPRDRGKTHNDDQRNRNEREGDGNDGCCCCPCFGRSKSQPTKKKKKRHSSEQSRRSSRPKPTARENSYHDPLTYSEDLNHDNSERFKHNIRTPSPKNYEPRPYIDPLTNPENQTRNRDPLSKKEINTFPRNPRESPANKRHTSTPKAEDDEKPVRNTFATRSNNRRTPSPEIERQAGQPTRNNRDKPRRGNDVTDDESDKGTGCCPCFGRSRSKKNVKRENTPPRQDNRHTPSPIGRDENSEPTQTASRSKSQGNGNIQGNAGHQRSNSIDSTNENTGCCSCFGSSKTRREPKQKKPAKKENDKPSVLEASYTDPLQYTEDQNKDNTKRYEGNIRTPSPKNYEPRPYIDPLANPNGVSIQTTSPQKQSKNDVTQVKDKRNQADETGNRSVVKESRDERHRNETSPYRERSPNKKVEPQREHEGKSTSPDRAKRSRKESDSETTRSKTEEPVSCCSCFGRSASKSKHQKDKSSAKKLKRASTRTSLGENPYNDPLKYSEELNIDNTKRYQSNIRTPSPKQKEIKPYVDPLANPIDSENNTRPLMHVADKQSSKKDNEVKRKFSPKNKVEPEKKKADKKQKGEVVKSESEKNKSDKGKFKCCSCCFCCFPRRSQQSDDASPDRQSVNNRRDGPLTETNLEYEDTHIEDDKTRKEKEMVAKRKTDEEKRRKEQQKEDAEIRRKQQEQDNKAKQKKEEEQKQKERAMEETERKQKNRIEENNRREAEAKRLDEIKRQAEENTKKERQKKKEAEMRRDSERREDEKRDKESKRQEEIKEQKEADNDTKRQKKEETEKRRDKERGEEVKRDKEYKRQEEIKEQKEADKDKNRQKKEEAEMRRDKKRLEEELRDNESKREEEPKQQKEADTDIKRQKTEDAARKPDKKRHGEENHDTASQRQDESELEKEKVAIIEDRKSKESHNKQKEAKKEEKRPLRKQRKKQDSTEKERAENKLKQNESELEHRPKREIVRRSDESPKDSTNRKPVNRVDGLITETNLENDNDNEILEAERKERENADKMQKVEERRRKNREKREAAMKKEAEYREEEEKRKTERNEQKEKKRQEQKEAETERQRRNEEARRIKEEKLEEERQLNEERMQQKQEEAERKRELKKEEAARKQEEKHELEKRRMKERKAREKKRERRILKVQQANLTTGNDLWSRIRPKFLSSAKRRPFDSSPPKARAVNFWRPSTQPIKNYNISTL